MKLGEIKRVFSLSKTVRKESEELDRLSGGALAAFFGGAVVIGVIGGGGWWVLAGMSGFLGAYNVCIKYIRFLPFFNRANIENFDELIDKFERVEKSALSQEIKDELNNSLLSQLPSASKHEIKQLPGLKNKDDGDK
ncbi:hypothetical protein [Halomonas sp. BM-2019]|uniref:hypothetical protein n=1 Tax=Halomonas sp. BM-2019 TaxID=2811227 RepID=UPI001B3C2699|nr:MAG: hypothetical protein J5F18_06790 [Halomonas sp. BM-2019]